MKITKTQRRVARKMMFPIVAILMMTLTMAYASSQQTRPATAHVQR